MSANRTQIALITGSNGFVGKWLIDHLQSKRFEVHGIDLQEQSSHPQLSYHHTDLLDASATAALIAGIQPDMVFHLAAVSYPPDADHSPRQSFEINIASTMAVLDAVRHGAPNARILLVGSAKQYSGSIIISDTSDGITEETLPRPTNFYGISKYAGELLGLQYCRQFGIDVRCTRSFNHTGPGQSPRFVCSDWAHQVAAISLGLAEPVITVGDVEATMDFSDVRDVVAAYCLILDKGKPGEVYNVCSGRGVALSWILDYFCSKSPRPVTIRQVDEKHGGYKSNVKMVGSHRKLTDHTGWMPAVPLQQTLDDLFDWWVRELERGEGRKR